MCYKVHTVGGWSHGGSIVVPGQRQRAIAVKAPLEQDYCCHRHGSPRRRLPCPLQLSPRQQRWLVLLFPPAPRPGAQIHPPSFAFVQRPLLLLQPPKKRRRKRRSYHVSDWLPPCSPCPSCPLCPHCLRPPQQTVQPPWAAFKRPTHGDRPVTCAVSLVNVVRVILLNSLARAPARAFVRASLR